MRTRLLPTSAPKAAVVSLAALLSLTTVLASCGNNDGTDDSKADTSPSPSTSESASESPSESPSETPSEAPSESPSVSSSSSSSTVPTQGPQGVYYVVDTRTGPRLARELTDLEGADPAKAAVEAMIAGPTDLDYTTTWNPRTKVLGVTQGARFIRVNLSGAARTANVGSAGAAAMIQQLVYTVTEVTDKTAPVQLFIEGKRAGELWGAVSWKRPVRRDAPMDVRLLVQIDTPREGTTTSSPLRVKGEAAAFEANVPWLVRNEQGKVVRRGSTLTSEGMRFAPYSFQVPLKPGTYTVQVSEDDPSGGEGGTPMRDTRTVTIK